MFVLETHQETPKTHLLFGLLSGKTVPGVLTEEDVSCVAHVPILVVRGHGGCAIVRHVLVPLVVPALFFEVFVRSIVSPQLTLEV